MKTWRITGTVEERETNRPLRGLIVRAFDRDVVFDDDLGLSVTNEAGHFEIRFDAHAFRDTVEQRSDLYLRVYDPTGSWVLYDSGKAVRWNAKPGEHFHVLVPAAELVPPHTRGR